MIDGSPGPADTRTPGAFFMRIRSLLIGSALGQGLIVFAAMSVANVLDYGYNVAMGRMLSYEGYGTLIALQALLQIAVVSLGIVRTVTARYVVEYEAKGRSEQTGAFIRLALRQAVLWGAALVALAAALSRPMARAFRIGARGAVLVMAASLLPLAIKPVIGGALQGLQKFTGYGVLQAVHAVLRLGAGIVLVGLGLDAVGAIAALPLATVGTIAVGLGLLAAIVWPADVRRAMVRVPGFVRGLFRYASKTTVALICFAALVNMDALVVKHYFDPLQAGYYSMAVTLGKIVLFLPLAFAQVLFSKSAERHVQRLDSSRLLWQSLLITALPCAALAAVYWAVPDLLLRVVFGAPNPFAGPVLGLVALAMSGYALVNVWINYYLSIERAGFVYMLPVALVGQFVLLSVLHASLTQVAAVVLGTSLVLLTAAALWFRVQRRPAGAENEGNNVQDPL